ncbi:hypothetical protein evm_009116, partial [Chilo suppressalis]
MKGCWLWVLAVSLHLTLAAAAGGRHLRRSMPTQQSLSVSKGGWRPVVGSGGLLYAGAYNTAPLHGPSYKIPIDRDYPSSARPLVARDSAKLTSIAQSYRPTTLRTVSSVAPAPSANQPINSYHNPFAYNNNLSYKFIQSFPVENIVIRNPQNPYAARPVYSKYPNKVKQSGLSSLQQLSNVQPIQFGQYQTGKPLYGKPVESYVRPTDNSGTEIFKPEVFKLPDSDTAQQSLSQTVKTAQQQQAQQQNQRQQQQQQLHSQQQQLHSQQQQLHSQQQQLHSQQQTYHQQQHSHHQQQHPYHQSQQQHQHHHQQPPHHQQQQQYQIGTPKTPYFTYQDPVYPPNIL